MRNSKKTLTVINDNEAAHAEESMQGIQSPGNFLLQHGRHLANKEVEGPIRCCR